MTSPRTQSIGTRVACFSWDASGLPLCENSLGQGERGWFDPDTLCVAPDFLNQVIVYLLTNNTDIAAFSIQDQYRKEDGFFFNAENVSFFKDALKKAMEANRFYLVTEAQLPRVGTIASGVDLYKFPNALKDVEKPESGMMYSAVYVHYPENLIVLKGSGERIQAHINRFKVEARKDAEVVKEHENNGTEYNVKVCRKENINPENPSSTYNSGGIVLYVNIPERNVINNPGNFRKAAFLSVSMPDTKEYKSGSHKRIDIAQRIKVQYNNSYCLGIMIDEFIDSRPDVYYSFVFGNMSYNTFLDAEGMAAFSNLYDKDGKLISDNNKKSLENFRKHDSLTRARHHEDFLYGYKEHDINFYPDFMLSPTREEKDCIRDPIGREQTYRRCFGNIGDENAPRYLFGWHQRIFYSVFDESRKVGTIKPLEYRSVDIMNMRKSYHAGVVGIFELNPVEAKKPEKKEEKKEGDKKEGDKKDEKKEGDKKDEKKEETLLELFYRYFNISNNQRSDPPSDSKMAKKEPIVGYICGKSKLFYENLKTESGKNIYDGVELTPELNKKLLKGAKSYKNKNGVEQQCGDPNNGCFLVYNNDGTQLGVGFPYKKDDKFIALVGDRKEKKFFSLGDKVYIKGYKEAVGYVGSD